MALAKGVLAPAVRHDVETLERVSALDVPSRWPCSIRCSVCDRWSCSRLIVSALPVTDSSPPDLFGGAVAAKQGSVPAVEDGFALMDRTGWETIVARALAAVRDLPTRTVLGAGHFSSDRLCLTAAGHNAIVNTIGSGTIRRNTVESHTPASC